MKDLITVHIRLPRAAHTKVRLLAIKRKKTIGEVIADLLQGK